MNMHTPLRRPTNVSLDQTLVAEARTFGINVSRACQSGLEAEIRRAREARWKADNRPAFDAYNAWIEKHGIPLARHRKF